MKHNLALLLFFTSFSVFSQDLVYEPKNPAFGGDTFNYQWLLSSADSQNTIENPDVSDPFSRDSEIERLTQTLNQQFFNQITREFFTNEFGENGLQPGNFTIGSLSVDISPSTSGLAISIIDTVTGESTTVILPFF